MGRAAVVLLITDSLEHDVSVDLGHERQRLQRAARRSIWLDPLLQWDEFGKYAVGLRMFFHMLTPYRNSNSSTTRMDLVEVISRPDDTGAKHRY